MSNVFDNTVQAPPLPIVYDQFAVDLALSSGLNITFVGGNIDMAGVLTPVVTTALVLTASAVNYICVDFTAGTIINSVGSVPAGSAAIYILTTDASKITNAVDARVVIYPGAGMNILSTNNTYLGTNTFDAAVTFNAAALFSGAATLDAASTLDVAGVTNFTGSTTINNLVDGYATTIGGSGTGTTTLTKDSVKQQYITGTVAHIFAMPIVTTLKLGQVWEFTNLSTAAVTVNSSGGNLIATVGAGERRKVTCIALTGTGAASWDAALDASFALSAGDITKVFSVGTATSAADAVRLDQLQPTYPKMRGLTLSTAGSSTTMSIAAGAAHDTILTAMMVLASAYTKTQDAWAVGTGSGGWDGTGAAPTTAAWFHWFLIQRTDTGVVDVIFSLSPTTPTLPTGYTLYSACIGSTKSIVTSGFWESFIQTGNVFQRLVPVQDVSATNPGSSAVLRTLSIPTGIKVKWFGGVLLRVVSDYAYISDPDTTDTGATSTSFTVVNGTGDPGGCYAECLSNTSGQVRSRLNAGSGGVVLEMSTRGWIHPRGEW